jgi:hypothetical protein
MGSITDAHCAPLSVSRARSAPMRWTSGSSSSSSDGGDALPGSGSEEDASSSLSEVETSR